MKDSNLMMQISEFVGMLKCNPTIEFALRGDEMQVIARWYANGQDFGTVQCFSVGSYTDDNIDITEFLIHKFNHEINKSLECQK